MIDNLKCSNATGIIFCNQTRFASSRNLSSRSKPQIAQKPVYSDHISGCMNSKQNYNNKAKAKS